MKNFFARFFFNFSTQASFVRMSMIVLGVRARFMQPGERVVIQVDQFIQLSPDVVRTGDSELLYTLLFDSQRHSRMPQMEPFPSCALNVQSEQG